MTAERELREIADTIRGFANKIVGGSGSGYLPAPEEGDFKALIIEAKQILEGELGQFNDFSSRLGSIGLTFRLSSPGTCINEAWGLIDGGIRQMQRRARPAALGTPRASRPQYVDVSRIGELVVTVRSRPS